MPDELVNDEQRMRCGDLAICMSSGSPSIVGKTAHLANDWHGSVGAFCAIIRFSPKLHHRFGSYWFRSSDFLQWRDSCAKGANIQNLRRTELEALSIPVPPLPDQNRIVKLLDEADELRKLRSQADDRTAKLIPALFHEMFGDPVANPKRFTATLLGEILTRVKNGANVNQKTDGFGIPVTRIETISSGNIDPERVKWCQPEPSLLAEYRLEVGDILFSHINSPKHIGKTAIYEGEPAPLLHGVNLLLLRPDQTKVCPAWLLSLLKLDCSRSFFRQRCKRAINQASLNQPDIKVLPVILPPLSLQNEFVNRVSKIRELEAKQATSRQRLDDLFQSMLHRAFSGEL